MTTLPETTVLGTPAGANAKRRIGAGEEDPFRVLLVEDDDSFRGILAQICRDEEAETLEASDGASALRAIADGFLPDLVVTDLNMAPINGLELIASLRADPRLPAVQTVMISAGRLLSADREALRAFGCPYIRKFEFCVKTFKELLAARIRG